MIDLFRHGGAVDFNSNHANKALIPVNQRISNHLSKICVRLHMWRPKRPVFGKEDNKRGNI